MISKKIITDNFKTLFYALIIAIMIRSLFFQPFYIPSSSMEPNLLIGDRLFVSKFSYGYSKHSFPFSPPIFKGRIFFKSPKRGDVIVFKTPYDNRTDYIKRLIGLPGDKVKFVDGHVILNNKKIYKNIISQKLSLYCGKNKVKANLYQEILPNKKKYKAAYFKSYSYQNSDEFVVPPKHFFFLGDNRDCSKDSRYLGSVGYVHQDNIVGKAQFIFFSTDYRIASIFKFWRWNDTVRLKRFFSKIH